MGNPNIVEAKSNLDYARNPAITSDPEHDIEVAKAYALIAIAESLDALKTVFEKWDKHSIPVITQEAT